MSEGNKGKVISEGKTYSPADFFKQVKDKTVKTDLEELQRLRENVAILYEKFKNTGQTKASKKLLFILNSSEKEAEAIVKGIDQYVYQNDIMDYIQNVASKVVKIQRLEEYSRDIPEEVVENYLKVKHLFDVFYVIFTDYTGEEERKVEKAKRDKDPILFGTFVDEEDGVLSDKFYFIGDWEDEFCDLTLEKMVSEMKIEDKNIVNNIDVPDTLKELKKMMGKYEYIGGKYVEVDENKSKSKIKNFFKKRKGRK